MLDYYHEKMNASLEYTHLSKWNSRVPKPFNLNPQSKFLEGIALNEVKGSFIPNCGP